MSFLSPERLWLLVAVAALVVLYVVRSRRRTRYAVRFTQLELLASVAPRRARWRRDVPAGLLALSLALLTVAFARPTGDVPVPRERATILVALDVSLSMEASDVDPTRDAAARRAAARFIENLPPRFNVGLVSFSGIASLVVPPTQDHRRVEAALQDLALGEGTAIGEAVLSSLDALSAVPSDPGQAPPPARIVLLSDGSNTVGRPVQLAVDAAIQAHVPVSTIAFGTPYGTVDVKGESIRVAVDKQALADLAQQTGGSSYTAESRDALSKVYGDIGSSVGTTTEKREVTAQWTGLGLLAAVGAVSLSLLWGTRMP